MPGQSYCRRLRSMCLCDVFRVLINSLVCQFYTSTLGLILFQIVFRRLVPLDPTLESLPIVHLDRRRSRLQDCLLIWLAEDKFCRKRVHPAEKFGSNELPGISFHEFGGIWYHCSWDLSSPSLHEYGVWECQFHTTVALDRCPMKQLREIGTGAPPNSMMDPSWMTTSEIKREFHTEFKALPPSLQVFDLTTMWYCVD